MAEIAANSPSGVVFDITATELTGADTLGSKSGFLYIENLSAGSVTINIDGDGASASYECRGAGEVDLTGGYDIVVGVDEKKKVDLGALSGYTVGTVAVTGGAADVFAWIEN